ncbi:MAG: hypothetical protein JGK17_31060 [Microcoleus sp. PH2017_10_PVI_O_A]|uniref:hypothetical protein n=1 Tax=unclassified Microcoleus TaxID=2642155 RepID=UPI001D5561D5|nr:MULTISPECIES: hypothetical protein [unclassified Microcoleus]MCC3409900.1 hypothetical protein [Microcoleus sp. PH2017_10_PVI_O_A]MCC3464074.1 hypothetical protein [Microcoleus sp. PH2017_11_PCY_U_A]MCC3482427.1 hypothetical protein [Microcoleus sp. PH2017_12_PCY_D_A]MCC3531013.1 hypothetical protein [Microcoleus sp. PH2017_21_RUC_O_A]MCC3539743.1 hypothetical protein [Microcoleus sp. PH2017_22_RUC_O_B]
MGSQTKYDPKTFVFVPIKIATTQEGVEVGGVNYAFSTNIPSGARTTLGQVEITDINSPPLGTVLASSFPKPRRASRRTGGTGGRFTSSFCSTALIKQLQVGGWRVSKPRVTKPPLHTPTLRPNSFIQTAYVTFRGIKYAWQLPKVTITNLTQAVIDQLGIKLATPSDFDELCFGAQAPKPPKASVTLGQGTGADTTTKTLSTFYDPSIANLPAGWAESKAPRIAFK